MPRFCQALAVLFLALSLAAANLGAAETNQAPLTGRDTLNAFLNEVTSYSAKFNQTLFDEYGEEIEQSSGNVALLKPGKFLWEYVEPYKQQIISNGQFLWIYDEDLEQVTINKLSTDGTNSPLALLVNGARLEDTYAIEAVARDDGLQWLALLPKSDEAQYQRVEIAVRATELARMRLHDNLNQVTDVEFVDGDKQAQIDTNRFEFQIPPGVDVINGLAE